jgi:hypothetical protein
MYTGASKATGIELSTGMLNNLYIQLADNQQVLTLNSPGLIVNGTVISKTGKFEYSGSRVRLQGDLDNLDSPPGDASISGIALYPNPASDYIYIDVSNTDNTYEYYLMDETGKTLQFLSNNQAINNFDVTGLKNGQYFLRVIDPRDQRTRTLHFVKSSTVVR